MQFCNTLLVVWQLLFFFDRGDFFGEAISYLKNYPANLLNEEGSPSGIRIKRGCIVLMIQPHWRKSIKIIFIKILFAEMLCSNIQHTAHQILKLNLTFQYFFAY